MYLSIIALFLFVSSISHITSTSISRQHKLVLFQLLINIQLLKKDKKKALDRQFREIKFPANTIFLCDCEIKDSRNVPRKFSRNLSAAKIKENRVVYLLAANRKVKIEYLLATAGKFKINCVLSSSS